MTSVSTRRLKWPADLPELELLETGFDTDVVYDVQRQPHGFSLVELAVQPPLRKHFSPDWRELASADVAVVCERGTRIVGAAAMSCARWNRRAVISHLYVDAAARGMGMGTRLLESLTDRAIELDSRQLFAETQNVNVPAVRFYERKGFTLVGLDTSFYDAPQSAPETALFFAMTLEGPNPASASPAP